MPDRNGTRGREAVLCSGHKRRERGPRRACDATSPARPAAAPGDRAHIRSTPRRGRSCRSGCKAPGRSGRGSSDCTGPARRPDRLRRPYGRARRVPGRNLHTIRRSGGPPGGVWRPPGRVWRAAARSPDSGGRREPEGPCRTRYRASGRPAGGGGRCGRGMSGGARRGSRRSTHCLRRAPCFHTARRGRPFAVLPCGFACAGGSGRDVFRCRPRRAAGGAFRVWGRIARRHPESFAAGGVCGPPSDRRRGGAPGIPGSISPRRAVEPGRSSNRVRGRQAGPGRARRWTAGRARPPWKRRRRSNGSPPLRQADGYERGRKPACNAWATSPAGGTGAGAGRTAAPAEITPTNPFPTFRPDRQAPPFAGNGRRRRLAGRAEEDRDGPDGAEIGTPEIGPPMFRLPRRPALRAAAPETADGRLSASRGRSGGNGAGGEPRRLRRSGYRVTVRPALSGRPGGEAGPGRA